MWNLQGFHLEFGWIQVESTRVLVIQVNLVGMVGIWLELFPVQVKFGWVFH